LVAELKDVKQLWTIDMGLKDHESEVEKYFAMQVDTTFLHYIISSMF